MDITEQTMLLFQNGTYYTKSRAVLEILKGLGLPWSIFYVSIIIPQPMRDFLYDFFARRRIALFGTSPRSRAKLHYGVRHACRVMTPDLESRFL